MKGPILYAFIYMRHLEELNHGDRKSNGGYWRWGVCGGMGGAGVERGGRRMWSSCFSLEDGKVQEMESSDSGMTV